MRPRVPANLDQLPRPHRRSSCAVAAALAFLVVAMGTAACGPEAGRASGQGAAAGAAPSGAPNVADRRATDQALRAARAAYRFTAPVRHAAVRSAPRVVHSQSSRSSTVRSTPKPAATRSVAATAFGFPVPVSLGNARQVITVSAHGSYATVAAWQLTGSSWHEVLVTGSARVGANGVVPAASRRQGTNTTPGGTFTLTQAFGISANPGTRMRYHQVRSDDWWVEDNASAYYNQMRTSEQGGFRTYLPESDVNGSEHLITHTVAYQYAVVIDYNRWPAVHYKGAGIFLHVNGAGATAGCVSVPRTTLIELLRWLNPTMHPRIAIA